MFSFNAKEYFILFLQNRQIFNDLSQKRNSMLITIAPLVATRGCFEEANRFYKSETNSDLGSNPTRIVYCVHVSFTE